MLTSHKRYCIQSRRKECKFKKHLFISQLKQLASWITTPAETETLNNSDCHANQSCAKLGFAISEEPSNKQDEMVTDRVDSEDRFDWFSDIDKTTYSDHTQAPTV